MRLEVSLEDFFIPKVEPEYYFSQKVIYSREWWDMEA